MQEEIFMYQKYKWKVIKMHINKNSKISSRVDPRKAIIKDNPKLYERRFSFGENCDFPHG